MSPSDCLARALRLLSGRSHFRRQLAEKLRARGFDELEVEETLERLTELGYVDDERTAGEFITTRRRRGPMGRRRMRAELERRGAESQAAARALEEAYSASDDLADAREAARRWVAKQPAGRLTAGEGGGGLGALGRHLDRLGFGTSSVLRVVSETRAGLERDGGD